MKEEKKEWWSNSIVNYDKITTETANLMLDQATKLLAETSETAKSISAKATQLITILIPLSTVSLGYISNNLLKNTFDFLTLTAILCVALFTLSGMFCYNNFKPYEIHVDGDYPHKLVASKFVDGAFVDNQQYVNLVLNICDNIENKLIANDKSNKKRVKNNEKAINALFMIPACPVLSYLILLLYQWLHCVHVLSWMGRLF